MTTTTTANAISYVTGGGANFAFPYPFGSALELVVALGGAAQVLNVNYTVAGAADPNGAYASGSVTFLSTPAAGLVLEIVRDTILTQEINFVANDPFLASSNNAGLDKLTRAVQDVKNAGGGGGTTVVGIPSTLNYDTLRVLFATVPPNPYLVIEVTAAGVRGLFFYDPTDTTSAENGGTVIVDPIFGYRFKRLYSGPVYPAWFSIDTTGVADSADRWETLLGYGIEIACNPTDVYLLSHGVHVPSNTKLYCNNALFKIKTGVGGYTNVKASKKNDIDTTLWLILNNENITIDSPRVTQDDPTFEISWQPLSVRGGFTSSRGRFNNHYYYGLTGANGGYMSINTVGDVECLNFKVRSSGITQGNTYWDGPPQPAAFQLDNDKVSSQPSVSCCITGLDVDGPTMTGQALIDYGSQTDGITIVGFIATGLHGTGLIVKNVGEALDCQGNRCSLHFALMQNCYNAGVKFIHGAQYNTVHVDVIDGIGGAAVVIAGSDTFFQNTSYNYVEVGTVKNVGAIAGPYANLAVAYLEITGGGGGPATAYATENTTILNNVQGNGPAVGSIPNLTYVSRISQTGADHNNRLLVRRAAGWATAFCTAVGSDTNLHLRTDQGTNTTLGMSGTQALTTTVPATVAFDTARYDEWGEANTATFEIWCATPGKKLVTARLFIQGVAAGGTVALDILKNGAVIPGGSIQYFANTTGNQSYAVSTPNTVLGSEAGVAAGRFRVRATVTSTGSPVILSASQVTTFSVVDMD